MSRLCRNTVLEMIAEVAGWEAIQVSKNERGILLAYLTTVLNNIDTPKKEVSDDEISN